MKSLKVLSISLLALGAFLLSFVPAKAQNYRGDYMYNNMYQSSYYPSSYNRYPDYFNRYYSGAVYPRTVYLIDSSNSANQLNIINARRNGSVTAAWITVRPEVYDRIVNDYNSLGIVRVSVDRGSDLVTFQTGFRTIRTYAVNIDYNRY